MYIRDKPRRKTQMAEKRMTWKQDEEDRVELLSDGTMVCFWLPGEEERGIAVWYDGEAIIVEPHCPDSSMRADVVNEKCVTIRYAKEGDKLKPLPPKPKFPPLRMIREGSSAPPCPKCGSSQMRKFPLFGKVTGCIQPECENYYGR